MNPRSAPALLLSITTAALFWACGSPPVAGGGDDFPNTLTASSSLGRLGAAAAEARDSAAPWALLKGSAGIAPSLEDTALVSVLLTASFPGPPGPSPLARALASNCDTTVENHSAGRWRWTSTCTSVDNEVGRLVRRDTVEILVTGTDTLVELLAVDSIKTRPLIRIHERAVDADGDGSFRFRAETGRIEWTSVRTAGNWSHHQIFVGDAGPDGLYDTRTDNRMWSGSEALLRGSDTVRSERIEPLDELPLIDPSRTGSVRARMRTLEPAPLSGVRRQDAVVAVFHDEARNHPLRWRADVQGTGYSWTDILAPLRDSSADLQPLDTARLLRQGHRGLQQVRWEALLTLGSDPSSEAGRRLLRVTETRTHSFGEIAAESMSVRPAYPTHPDEEVTSGHLTVRIDRRDGLWAQAELEFDSTRMTGTYIDVEGVQAEVMFDRAGRLLLWRRIR